MRTSYSSSDKSIRSLTEAESFFLMKLMNWSTWLKAAYSISDFIVLDLSSVDEERNVRIVLDVEPFL